MHGFIKFVHVEVTIRDAVSPKVFRTDVQFQVTAGSVISYAMATFCFYQIVFITTKQTTMFYSYGVGYSLWNASADAAKVHKSFYMLCRVHTKPKSYKNEPPSRQYAFLSSSTDHIFKLSILFNTFFYRQSLSLASRAL